MMDFTLPHEGSKDCWYFAAVASSYWVSPRGRIAVGLLAMAMSDVYRCRQVVAVPSPPLKSGLLGSHAMSPTARISGSAPVADPVVAEAEADRAEWFPAGSNASTV